MITFPTISVFNRRGGSSGPNGAPSNLVLTVNAKDGLSATFDSSSTDQDGYRAYVSTGGAFIANNTSVSSPINITGLTVGQFYQVKIVAYKGVLESDPCNTITETWSQGLTRSFLNINSHATWTSAQIALIRGRLDEQYVIDTFGPSGQNKTVCDFFIFVQSTAVLHTTATNTKTGDTLRWNYGGGNIYSQNNLPAQTSTTEITVTSTDGFGAVTKWTMSNNNIGGNIPNLPYYFPNCTYFDWYGAGAGNWGAMEGDITDWVFNNNTTYIRLQSNNLSGDLTLWQLPDKITTFFIYSNTKLTGKTPSLKATRSASASVTYNAYNCSFTGIGDLLYQRTASYVFCPTLRLDGNYISTSDISALISNMATYYTSNTPYNAMTLNLNGIYNGTILGDELNEDLITLRAIFTAASKTLTLTYNSVDWIVSQRPTYDEGEYDLLPFNKPTLVLTQDDGFVETYTQEYPMILSKGKKGTTYILDIYDGSHLTEIQIKAMQAQGWEIGGHPAYNVGMDATAIRAASQAIINMFATHGYGTCKHFAYGGGYYNALVESIMPEYVLSCRTINATTYDYIGRGQLIYKDNAAKLFRLPSHFFEPSTEADYLVIKNLVKKAYFKNAGLIIYNHILNAQQLTWLEDLVDYAISLNFDIITHDELYAKIIA